MSENRQGAALDLEGLRKLAEAATPGPWFFAYTAIYSKPRVDEHNEAERLIPSDAPDDDPRWDALPESVVATVTPSYGDTATGQRAADAESIAAARTGWPATLAEIERLRARVTELEEMLDECCEICDGACPHRKDDRLSAPRATSEG